MSGTRLWSDLSWPQCAALDPARTVAILPVSAIEQHGPHLPLGTDARINRAALEGALARLPEDLPVWVLPECPFGKSDEHAAYPGTLTLSTETLMRLWFEIGQSVHRSGVRKLLILNSHGGQSTVGRIVVQDLRVRLGLFAVLANTYSLGAEPPVFDEDEQHHGIHAGAIETSLMLHLQPQQVRRDAIADFRAASLQRETPDTVLRTHGPTVIGWATQDLHPSGACGNATLARAPIGQALVDDMSRQLARLLQEMVAYPLDRLRSGPLEPLRPPAAGSAG